MNESISGGRPRRRQPGLARAGVLAAAMAGTALLAVACGAGSPSGGKPAAHQRALEYAHCMRSHGVPGFPDPTSNGTISTSGISLNAPLFSSARAACQYLQAGVSFQLSPAQQQALLNLGLKTAACMRAHGITNFPDPRSQDISTSGGVIAISMGPRGKTFPAERNSPQFQAAIQACSHFRPSGGS